jgi:hypothetical protein
MNAGTCLIASYGDDLSFLLTEFRVVDHLKGINGFCLWPDIYQDI